MANFVCLNYNDAVINYSLIFFKKLMLHQFMKKDSRMEEKKYCPVRRLPNIFKIVQKIMHSQIMMSYHNINFVNNNF